MTSQQLAPAPGADGPCPRCDQVHPKCTAHRRDGNPCTKPKVPGATVCRYHGGGAPQVQQAALQRLQQEGAYVAVRTLGLPIVIDPTEALLEELHRCAGAIAWHGAQVAALQTEDVYWGLTREKTGGDDAGTTHEAGLNVAVKAWQAERDRLVVVARECLKAGIEERRIQLAETQGAMLAGVVRAILNRLNLTDEQQALVSVVVPEELRRIAELPPGGNPA